MNLSSWILASLQIETVTEQGEDLLNREEQSLQSEQSQSAARRAKNRTGSRGQASRGRSIRAAAARGWHSPRAAENGKTRGARRGQRSRSTITLTKAAQLSLTDPEVVCMFYVWSSKICVCSQPFREQSVTHIVCGKLRSGLLLCSTLISYSTASVSVRLSMRCTEQVCSFLCFAAYLPGFMLFYGMFFFALSESKTQSDIAVTRMMWLWFDW